MQKKFSRKEDGHFGRKRCRQTWRRVIAGIMCMMVLFSSGAPLPSAFAMEYAACGITEHVHDEGCYRRITSKQVKELVCTAESEGHVHTDDCYADNPEIARTHTHSGECYETTRGKLICEKEESEGHTHGEECRDENGELICQSKESEGHLHDNDCYEMEQVLTCGLSEESAEPELVCGKEETALHEHTSECFETVEIPVDADVLTCTLTEDEDHVHGPLCYGEWELICDLPEHTHSEECLETEADGDGAASDAINDVVIRAFVELTGEDEPVDAGIMKNRQRLAENEQTGDISGHLTLAEILINGEPYKEGSLLNPGEQFAVKLVWQLGRDDLNKTLTYTYDLPEQIRVENVENGILYDANNNRRGVYSIIDGTLTVTYDNDKIFDLFTTTFELNATWNQEKISQDTTVVWKDDLKTRVKFDNARIAVTKKLLTTETMADGRYVMKYAVNVTASGNVDNITLKDKMESEKFHFYKGYYEVGGETYNYCYKVTGSDGIEEYQYGNFGEKDADGAVTFTTFNLKEGQTYTVEYAVLLNADDRFELDQNLTPASLTNTATASYPYDGDTISSSVTVKDTYRADEKWVVKERGKLTEGEVDQDTNIPWTVSVNPARVYDMGGAVIGDHIQTENVFYKTNNPLKIKMTTGSGEDSHSTETSATWITLSNETVANIWSAGNKNAIELLFSEDGASVLAEIRSKVEGDVTSDNISQYVFINESKNQFVWFAPEKKTPTTYELSYVTDASEAVGDVLANSAGAGWKQWAYSVVSGSFLQEIEIEKTNDGTYQKDDGYFVDWTITLRVPGNCNAIPNVFLYDELPYHEESEAYDRLVNLKASEFDYARLQDEEMEYLKDIAQPAFTISTDSANESVMKVVDEAFASLGHPVSGLTIPDYRLYEAEDTLRGQFPVSNAEETEYNGKRMTPARFGIWLGDLPNTLNSEDGYIITVTYTTQVDPKLVSELDGRAFGYNYVALIQRNGGSDVFLANADASYWVDRSTAQNVLAKSVADFDSDTNIVTYQVNINPEADLVAASDADYILKDVLGLTGAQFIDNSFSLSFLGTVDKNSAAFHWDNSKKTILWRGNGGEVGLTYEQSEIMKTLVKSEISNSADGSSNFTFTLTNRYNVLALSTPDDAKGKLAPMVLTYQVKLPEGTTALAQETITNTVTLDQKSGDNTPVQLDSVKTTFDYTSALHKHLSVAPNGSNSYTATFVIDVDKSVKEWENVGDTFTVSDEMSKTLVVDITSIRVYGINPAGKEDELSPLKGEYTAAYNNSMEEKNLLSVTIKDSKKYAGYRIEYDARVQGIVGEIVEYDNTACVYGTEIRSETIEKDVYIQKQTANVDGTNYEVKLLKFDANNTAVKLKATFTLYVYENNSWKEKLTNLTTDNEGELILNNDNYSNLGLAPGKWYKLEETSAPTGYVKSITYFRIGRTESDETRPGEIGDFTPIPLEGGIHQIPNYKAELQLLKVDAENSDKHLSGAEFGLFKDEGCTQKLADSKYSVDGVYTFELNNLEPNKIYYLKELKAPNGYQLSETVYTVIFDTQGKATVKKDGETVASIENAAVMPNQPDEEPETPEDPETPEEPETPEDPETPEEPGSPEEFDVPEEPDIPESIADTRAAEAESEQIIKESSEVVPTGDTSPLAPLLCMMGVSAGAMIAVFVRNKQRQGKRKK